VLGCCMIANRHEALGILECLWGVVLHVRFSVQYCTVVALLNGQYRFLVVV
jgi:hypothetical protein